ncbi:hypothetical protein Nmel_001821 [Mimus melanotis]
MQRSTATLSLQGEQGKQGPRWEAVLEETERGVQGRAGGSGRSCRCCFLWYRTDLLPATPQHTSITSSCFPSSKHLSLPHQQISVTADTNAGPSCGSCSEQPAEPR